MTIIRFSSRSQRLDQGFLTEHLKRAVRYRRIAGYFTSSLFEVAGELITRIPQVQIVCNADVQADDLRVARMAEARLLGRWNEQSVEAEALLKRERYRLLDDFLRQHRQAIRVAPDALCGFVHGKAGVIDLDDGRQLGFIGSMNESRSGWREHYEILWSDDSPQGVTWIEEEFDYLWRASVPLPDAVCREISRRSRRQEVAVDDVDNPDDLAPSALVESPLYREGFSLQPWQRSFVTDAIRHYREYGAVRMLLADEVGLGKTLSMGTAALTIALLAEQKRRKKPIVIFAPATLCEQWQVEMLDKLGIPCGRWQTLKKAWVDSQGRVVSPEGVDNITRCPLRIGIISTGLVLRDSLEKQYLLGLRGGFELFILDESHKARTRQGMGRNAGTPNELLAFSKEMAARSDHVIIGTATPIQTNREDLWDQMRILHQGKGRFVLGNDFSPWHRPLEIIPIMSGEEEVVSQEWAWELMRSPLPPTYLSRDSYGQRLYSSVRQDLSLAGDQWDAYRQNLTDLSQDTRDDLENALDSRVSGATFFQRENPFVRHIVLRKRVTLEDAGLLTKIAVDIHPNADLAKDPYRFGALFEGLALRSRPDFLLAYNEAIEYGNVLAKKGRGHGFMRNLMQQRMCSSIVAGRNTALALLRGKEVQEETDDQGLVTVKVETPEEHRALERLLDALQSVGEDPKLKATIHYLEEEGWLSLGVIIFSQYYDTSHWVASELAARYKDERIGLYAGAGRSRLFHAGESVGVDREVLKGLVAERQIRLMVATDAACEGLNLQTLGTLINIDLPWNPIKLEQRIGRIKRFGQAREKVDMLNLVNQATVDEKVYDRLSERMRDRYDLFGSLPDTIKDDWITEIESLGAQMDQYIENQKRETGFDIRYSSALAPSEDEWRDCSKVLARRDLEDLMRQGWG